MIIHSVLTLFKESVSLIKLDDGCPPTAPCSNSVLGPIQHDMQEY
jgi:hypothetical protein